jgi:beta-glucosidase
METNQTPTYKNSALPIKERVNDLVSRMTVEEKISQMVYDAPAIERLDVPAYNWWSECLHGVARAGIATVFPQAIGLAATWNADLMLRVATAISDEARAKYHDAIRRGHHQQYFGLTYWSPNVNLFRDPRWGRGQETYGECPYLSAQMGVAFVKGLQGDDERYLKTVATPKHYVVHSGPEPKRHTFDKQVSERDFRESYLPAFEACVTEADAYSVMGAYDRTNGEACCASKTLLEEILREELGFEGYVVSDCGAIRDIYKNHQIVETPEEAAALAVKNGCDLNCGMVYPALQDAFAQGLIDEATIDKAVKRLFTARFRLGMFDPPEEVPYAQIPITVNDSPTHKALALEAARESIVLLKNEDDLLPLDKELDALAIIGPNADDLQVLQGNYSGTPSRAISMLEGIRQKASSSTEIYYAPGCGLAEGMPILDPIPPHSLRPINGDAGQVGMRGAYYDNPNFEGEPVKEQIDAAVDFVWKGYTPITGEVGDLFSVRWTGTLIPPETGTYKLGVRGCTGFRLYVDGEEVLGLDLWYNPTTRTAEVELEAGRLYHLRLDYKSARTEHDPHVQLLWSPPSADPLAEAIAVASKADAVVAVMGLSSTLEGEEMPVEVPGFKGGDRIEIGLPAPQKELLKRIHALGKPMILVLLSGSALAVNWAAEHVPAIIEVWYPGQASGPALADVLFGDYNPAGRLPVTFYKSVEDLPHFEDYDMADRTYRYFQGEPLYAFGHGLSYTTFDLTNLRLTDTVVDVGDEIAITVDVTNTGMRAGDEVVQLYVHQPDAPAPTPIKALKGFQRVSLTPGETKTVTFHLHTHQLGCYDDAGNYIVNPGSVEVYVGDASDHLPLSGQVEIGGEPTGAEKVFFSRTEVS